MTQKKKTPAKLKSLEEEIKTRGVHLSYEKMQFAGLRLKSGMCLFKGEYYLFIDRFKPNSSRMELLEAALAELDEIEAKGGGVLESLEGLDEADSESGGPDAPPGERE